MLPVWAGALLLLFAVRARAQFITPSFLRTSSASVTSNVGVGTAVGSSKLDVRGGSITMEQSPLEVFLAAATQTTAVTTTGPATTWTAVPGMSSTFTLARTMTVRMHVRGSAAGVSTAHCGVRFVVDGAAEGDPTWGNVIFYASGIWQDFSTELEVSLGVGSHTISAQLVSNQTNGCYTDGGDYSTMQMWIHGR